MPRKKKLDWTKIKYFKESEWGDVSKLEPNLIYLLDEFREFVGKPIVIHCAYDKNGHTTNSQHYLGKAVDFHIKGMNWRDQYYAAVRFGKWTGIGVYPDWNNPGLHCDIRDLDKNKSFAKWCRWQGKYIGTDEATFNNIARLKGEPIR